MGSGTQQLRIFVDSAKYPHESAFLSELALTASHIGHCVNTPGTGEIDLVIQWGLPRKYPELPTLIAECGWLPRWHYQLSHAGINARHHAAPLELRPIDREQIWKVRVHLDRLRRGDFSGGGPIKWGYCNILAPPVKSAPREFLLAPLQMERDINMQDLPERLRTNQGFVDEVVSQRDTWMPGVRIVFKQHPHSEARCQLGLETRDRGDKIYPHSQGHVYQYLKHPGCRAVIVANSNVANDALIWDVPTVALGRGIWPERVFLRSLADLQGGSSGKWLNPLAKQRRMQYLYALISEQWRLSDARDPQRVAWAIDGAIIRK